MNKIIPVAAMALSAIFSGTALAEDAILKACSRDGKTVTMSILAEGSVKTGSVVKSAKEIAQNAFSETARSLYAADMASQASEHIFWGGVHAEKDVGEVSPDFLIGIHEPPTTSGPACRLEK